MEILSKTPVWALVQTNNGDEAVLIVYWLIDETTGDPHCLRVRTRTDMRPGELVLVTTLPDGAYEITPVGSDDADLMRQADLARQKYLPYLVRVN